MSDKKTKRSVLGPRGRRKLGLAKGENYKDPGGHQSGYLGSQVKQRKMLDQEGFGVFPQGWLERCKVEPKEKKTATFVLPNPRNPRRQDVNAWEAAKLATPNKMDSLPIYTCFNPFTDPRPWADGQPLPRSGIINLA